LSGYFPLLDQSFEAVNIHRIQQALASTETMLRHATSRMGRRLRILHAPLSQHAPLLPAVPMGVAARYFAAKPAVTPSPDKADASACFHAKMAALQVEMDALQAQEAASRKASAVDVSPYSEFLPSSADYVLEKVCKLAKEVKARLGQGKKERAYQNALEQDAHDFSRKHGLDWHIQTEIETGTLTGKFVRADMTVNNVLFEFKRDGPYVKRKTRPDGGPRDEHVLQVQQYKRCLDEIGERMQITAVVYFLSKREKGVETFRIDPSKGVPWSSYTPPQDVKI
jgi:hypothetical protein